MTALRDIAVPLTQAFEKDFDSVHPGFNLLTQDLTYDEIETRLFIYVGEKLKHYTPPTFYNQVPAKDQIPESLKWRCISAMQKSIRRGHVEDAQREALIVHGCDQGYAWSRLVVIALEDIGVGDPAAVAQALVAAKNKAWRDSQNSAKTLCYVVEVLAKAVKDRTVCDLFNWMIGRPVSPPTWEKLTQASPSALSAIALGNAPSFTARIGALWLLYGTQFFENKYLPQREPDKPLFETTVNMMKVPALIRYITLRSTKATRWGMCFTYPFAWEMLLASPWLEIKTNPIPAREYAGGVAMEAYDKHTKDGGVAINRFITVCEPVRELIKLKPLGYKDKVNAVGICIFVDEGAVLNRYVDFAGMKRIYDLVVGLDFESHSAGGEWGKKLRQAVKENMKILNECRREVSEK